MHNDILAGTLETGGYLKTEAGRVLLTETAAGSGRSPESAALAVNEEQIGKTALVRGERSGGFLYEAELLELLPPVSAAVFAELFAQGSVSLDTLAETVADVVPESPQIERLCALVIGHKKDSPGAVNAGSGLSEFDFNEALAMRIEAKVRGVRIQRIYRRTYDALPADINALGPDFIVSLHCNAYDTEASGTEVLYYHRSERGRQMAALLQTQLLACLRLPDRGIRPKTSEDRGGYLLRNTDAPCVIAEPFFIDNDGDLARARADEDALAEAYAKAIEAIAQTV